MDSSPPPMPSNVTLLKHRSIHHLMTYIRDKTTSNQQFPFYADRLHRILAEEGIAHLPGVETAVTTPTECEFKGWKPAPELKVCGVSIVRAGDSLLGVLRECWPGLRVGKILIQRDETTAQPKLFYSKFPPDIKECFVLLVDPMLATGGSANMAIDVLNAAGVMDDRIIFLNVVSCPEGARAMHQAHPQVKIITTAYDECLNEHCYIMPGLGDYGDRYFNTTPDPSY